MGIVSSNILSAHELVGYEPLVDSKPSLKELQFRAIELGVNPLISCGRSKTLNIEKDVKIAMRNARMTFTLSDGLGYRYCKIPKSRRLLEKQIRRLEMGKATN